MITSYNLRDSDGKLAVPLPRTITKIALAIVVQFSGTVYPSSRYEKLPLPRIKCVVKGFVKATFARI